MAERAAALSAAVALAAAHYHAIDAPPDLLATDIDPVELQRAQSWLSALLVEHGAAGLPGERLLQLIGRITQWVDSGGEG